VRADRRGRPADDPLALPPADPGDPDHYVVLDARRPVEELAAAIDARLAPLLGQARR
jgi:hypothetical protein